MLRVPRFLLPDASELDAAIAAHLGWKETLTCYLDGTERTLDADAVACDRRCRLGRWIHGRGRLLAFLPEYETLRGEHARFHWAAASIVARVHAGHDVTVTGSLEGDSAYAEASAAVITALLAMKHKITR